MSRVRNVNASGPVQKHLERNPGAQPPSISVVSSQEFDKWKGILQREGQDSPERKSARGERDQKKELSVARSQHWGNTVEGTTRAKQEALTKRLEEAERRRCVIDEEERQFHEAEKRAFVDEANRQLLQRDERVMNMNTQLKLHEVLQEREEQVELSARRKQFNAERRKEYDDIVLQEAAAERQRNKEKVISARQLAKKVATAQLHQLESLQATKRTEKGKHISSTEEV